MSNNEEFLYRQLEKLGDLMGDGEHLQPGGSWISQEYKSILRQLDIYKPKSNVKINDFMVKRCQDEKCTCGGELKQTRKGSYVAKCVTCEKKFRLGKTIWH